jgi:hypothetical protein
MKNEAKLFALKYKDFIKGFMVAVLTVVMTGAMTSLQAGAIPTLHDLKNLAIVGLGAGIAYITNSFLRNSDGQLLKKEAEQPK